MIHLDVDAAEFGKRRAADVGITTDLKRVLPALAMTLTLDPGASTAPPWLGNTPSATTIRVRPSTPRPCSKSSSQLPDTSVVACDVGQHQMWVAQHMRFTSPQPPLQCRPRHHGLRPARRHRRQDVAPR